MTLDQVISGVLGLESGEYTNDSSDSGGPTKWGITLATLSDYVGRPATAEEVQALSMEKAHDIYFDRYVTKPAYDQVNAMSQVLGPYLVQAGVLCGVETVSAWVQRSLNALNLNGTHYPDAKVDGNLGPKSIESLKEYLSWRGQEGEKVLFVAIECLFGEHLIGRSEKRQENEKYIYGWLLKRVNG